MTTLTSDKFDLRFRKQSKKMAAMRERVHELEETTSTDSDRARYYVSRLWYNKLATFADPGPISNNDFLCQHAGLSSPAEIAFFDFET